MKKPFMILNALVLFASIGATESFAACDQCQRPQVVQFDLRVVPARPSDSTDPQRVAKTLEWRNLFWTSAGVKGYLFNEDPTKDCFTHLDGSFYTQGDTVGHSLKFGEEWSNLPPASGRAGGDYLVSGSVDGAAGSYKATVELRVSKTGEVVATASKSFTSSDEPLTIGRLAASATGPIVDKIRLFEKSKRATGDPYALGPTAELHPAKTDLKEGESVEVEVWLYDCDGDIATSPLADRPVRISVTNGTVSESEVTTGSDGKAKFTFTAGSKPAEAMLTAIYPYTLASGRESASEPGYAALRIQEIPTSLWRLQGTLIRLQRYDETTRSNYAQIAEGGRSNQSIVEAFRVSGVLRNVSKDTSQPFLSDVEAVQLQVEGNHAEDQISWGFFQSPNGWSRSQSYQTVYARPVRSSTSKPSVSFQYFFEPGAARKAVGQFSLYGLDLAGNAKTTGTSCNSEDGCKPIDTDDEASDQIDIAVLQDADSAKNHTDSTYVDMAGIHHTYQMHRSIVWEKGEFRIESLEFEETVTPGEGTVGFASSTATRDKRISLRVSPLDDAQKNPNSTYPKRLGRSSSWEAKVFVKGGRWTVDFRAGAEGTLQARLFGLDGRILAQESRKVPAGERSESFELPVQVQGMAIADVRFAASSGERKQAMQKLPAVVVPTGLR